MSFSFTDFSVSKNKNVLFTTTCVTWPHSNMILISGDNGVGKTTLLSCIAGLHAYRGKITSPYAKITYISSDMWSNITPLTTPNDILALRAIRSDNGPSFFDVPLKQISKGQLSMFCIYYGLTLQADCILFDEPFAHLDRASRHELLDALITISKRTDIVVVDHLNKEIRKQFGCLVHLRDRTMHVCTQTQCQQKLDLW